MERKKVVIVGVALAVVVIMAVALEVSLSPAALPASRTVYVDPHQSFCKGGATFSCTIVLEASQGGPSIPAVKSVQINGTNTQPTLTATGGSVTIQATLPSISMQHGLADVGPSVKPPTVGSVVVDLSDGTTVSALLGPGGVLQ